MLLGVRVTRVVQAPGEYVITFPRAYHGGFSNGFCVGEAVNFSIGDWFPFGLEAAQRYRRLSRLPVLAHDELLCLEGLAIHGRATSSHTQVSNAHARMGNVFLGSCASCLALFASHPFDIASDLHASYALCMPVSGTAS